MRNLITRVAVCAAAATLVFPGSVGQASGSPQTAPVASCQSAKKALARARDQAASVYRAEVRAARREFKRSKGTKADRTELAAHIADSRQARRALTKRAKAVVQAKC